MSELSNLRASLSFISKINLGSTEQSQVNLEGISSAGKIKSSSIEQSFLDKNHTVNDNKTDESVGGFELLTRKNVQAKYPLTERSKREKAAKIRVERERKSEQIKKINENITCGAEAIKVHNGVHNYYNRSWVY